MGTQNFLPPQQNSPDSQIPWQFGMNQRIQARRLKMSAINIKNPGTLSNVSTALSTIGPGSTQFILDTLTPLAPHGTEMNFAIPYVSVYEGTTNNTSNLIYPILGANKSWGSYSFMGALDWDTFAQATPSSVISTFDLTIHNNMAGSGTFYYVSQWKYLNFNSGTVQ